MPNHVCNTLTIKGNQDDLNRVLNFVKSDRSLFDFDKILPMPDYIYQCDLGGDVKLLYVRYNWYDWAIDNWGTKWNSQSALVEDNRIWFLTANTPCIPVVTALAQKFPTMRFEYVFDEGLVGMQGEFVFENGELIFHEYDNGDEYLIPDDDYDEDECSNEEEYSDEFPF